MQEKLDLILNKLEEISERIGKIEERVDELENDAAAERNDILCEVQAVTQFLEIFYEFQEMDFCELETENLIFLHTNALRTASFVKTLVGVCGALTQVNQMKKEHLTPAYLADIMKRERHIVVKSDVFAWSDEFETLISGAIAADENNIYILTNDVECVPQSIREKMRVIQ